MKTNAARLLQRPGITCELRDFEVDPAHLAAETVARKIGLPPQQVFQAVLIENVRATGAMLAAIARARA